MSSVQIARGPVMLDVVGVELNEQDRQRLLHPLTGAVILFARNYASPQQIADLSAEIRALRSPSLLIAVDHEGGRVQRFRTGFTAIPPMAELGRLWGHAPERARETARDAGRVIAAELAACGIDFSFTPVLDLDFGVSLVIGDRAFHREPDIVAQLSIALMQGLRAGGMAAVGKHFPGHGFVAEDSHLAIPVDQRSLAQIEAADLQPYPVLIAQGLEAVMPAHVIYPQVDAAPAGYSSVWLQRILRGQLGFDGLIFSDDLSMEGASVAGDITQRAHAALQAGCDMVLVCNKPAAADQLLSQLHWAEKPEFRQRLVDMQGRAPAAGLAAVQTDADYLRAKQHVAALSGEHVTPRV